MTGSDADEVTLLMLPSCPCVRPCGLPRGLWRWLPNGLWRTLPNGLWRRLPERLPSGAGTEE